MLLERELRYLLAELARALLQARHNGSAHAVHLQCTCSAHTVHMQCTCSARAVVVHAVHTCACAYSAHACLDAWLGACSRAPRAAPAPPAALPPPPRSPPAVHAWW
eukprot:scaffold31358_cov36-Phaeocystis_antarctica.AAC.4